MRVLYLSFFLLPLIFTSQAYAGIGEITESNGKVQIKTIKAKRIEGTPGTEISLGDLLKVRKKSAAFVRMKDDSEFQISAKTTLIFDDFLFDSQNQKMRARIINGALAYAGEKLVSNGDREFSNRGFTLTIRGTKFAGKFGSTSQVVLLKGAVSVNGKGDDQMLSGPLQSVIFDQSGVGKPFKMSVEEIRVFFDDNGLDFERLVGPDYEESLDTGGSLCIDCN